MSGPSKIALAVLWLLTGCATSAGAQELRTRPAPGLVGLPAQGERTIVVTGTGEAKAMPDEAFVDFSVETQAPTAKAAAELNARRAEAVTAALVEAGIAKKDVETRDYNLFPEFAQTRDGQDPKVRGYRAANRIGFKTRDFGKLGPALDRAIAAGANRVENVRFGLANPEPAQGRALADAVLRARRSAEVIAGALGVKLGEVMEATTAASPPPWVPVPYAAKALGLEAADAPATPLQAQEQTVTATVTVRFAIHP